MLHSVPSNALWLASFDVVLSYPLGCCVSEWPITHPIVCDYPWHHIDLLCIHALTSAHAFAAAACRARLQAPPPQAPLCFDCVQGLSSRFQLILLASHSMTLTREHKNLCLIGWEIMIEIFSIFAWLVPTLVLKHNLRFRVSTAQSVDCNDWVIFVKHFVEGFLVECCFCALLSCFCALLRNRSKFDYVALRW